MDFKENIKLGGGPIEIGNDFYTRQQCSVLGMAIVYREQVTKQPRLEYLDFFSDILSHDALFASDCINKVLHLFLFQKLLGQSKITKVHFWNDTGRHFQCGELAHFLLTSVPIKFGVQVTWNFFGEHHGKSIIDGHFGLLSRIMKDIEKRQHIDTIGTLIGCLRERFDRNNRVSKNKGVQVHFFIYDREERAKYINTLTIKNLCDYYFFESCVSNENTRIRSKVYSNSEQVPENIKTKTKRIEDNRKTTRGSISTEEARGNKRKLNSNNISNIFGKIVTERSERRRSLQEIPQQSRTTG